MKIHQWVMLITLMCCADIVCAQPRVTGTVSLRDAISATLAANPQLDSFPLKRESLSGQRETATLRRPLTLNAGTENALGTGDLSSFSAAEFTLSLSRIIELGDKRDARVNVTDRRLDLLASERRVVELDLLAETTFRFINVAAAQERVTLQAQALALANQTVQLVTPLVDAGQSPALELTRANATLSRAQIARRAAETRLEAARLRLSSMWGSQDPRFDAVEADLFTIGAPGSLTPLLLALNANPDIAVFSGEQRLRAAQLRQARAQQQSNIQWTAGIRHLTEVDDTALVFSVSVPLFSQSRATGSVRSAMAQTEEVEARRQAALNTMRTQLHTLHLQLGQAVAEAETLQENVLPNLNEVLEQTRTAFESGRYSYVELISAQREYLDAELALINNAANAHRLRAEIERLSGEPLPASQ